MVWNAKRSKRKMLCDLERGALQTGEAPNGGSMDSAAEIEQFSATFCTIAFVLAIIVVYLLAVRYLLGQPRTRRYRNTLLAALICLIPLDALSITAKLLPEGMDLPAPLEYLGVLYLPLSIVILYAARRYRKTMSQKDGRPVLYIDLVYWLTLMMLAFVLLGLSLAFLFYVLSPYWMALP